MACITDAQWTDPVCEHVTGRTGVIPALLLSNLNVRSTQDTGKEQRLGTSSAENVKLVLMSYPLAWQSKSAGSN